MAFSPKSQRHIVIVGGGFTGAALARALIEKVEPGLALTIVEPRALIGGGVAYSTEEPAHLMNGPATLAGIRPGETDHFARWLADHLRENHIAADAWRHGDDLFAPRALYGRYILSELEQAIGAAGGALRFSHVRARAADLSFDGERARVALDSGEIIEADHVVLASGAPRARPQFETHALAEHPAYLSDPWRLEAYARLAGARRVAIIGVGLTMLDVVISLERAGFRGSVQAISRRGLSVAARRGATPWPGVLDSRNLPVSSRDLLRTVQRARREVKAANADWQTLPVAIVPHIDTIWRSANDHEKRRYLQRLRPFWEITRHRAAPPTAKLAEAWRAEGRLRSAAGHVFSVTPQSDGQLAVKLRWRGQPEVGSLDFDGVINASGSEYDVHRAARKDPLLDNLLTGGAVRSGPASFGLDALRNGAAIGRSGQVNERLSAIGPLLRGVFWESNAISEILPKVHALAARLAAAPIQPANGSDQ